MHSFQYNSAPRMLFLGRTERGMLSATVWCILRFRNNLNMPMRDAQKDVAQKVTESQLLEARRVARRNTN